ncbi:hypothetical protein PhCBS80983_g03406 [Powellomyces hirtus]|uniref:Ribosomal protein L22 n=1 Tax=Powellomyces hirtus TaxID=109895 RepID=A0A507E2J0_9FUNG|nr:hypothetical protein PhCBS80983_g03406 [Powellomyces hirtus]
MVHKAACLGLLAQSRNAVRSLHTSIPSLVAVSSPLTQQHAPKSNRPNVYPKLRQDIAPTTSTTTTKPSSVPPPTAVASDAPFQRSTVQQQFLARLARDGGDRIVTFRRNILHTEYTRFLTLCDQVKGLTLDQALLQIKWLRKPITKKMEDALKEAIVKAKEEGLDLNKTYVADAYVKKNAAILQNYLVKRYLRGRGRYGSTPHPVSTLLELTLQERDKPFQVRENDPLEWLRDRLRERQKPFAKSAEQVYEEVRTRRKVKEVFC